MSTQLALFNNTNDTTTPLPLLVAKQWAFPLQYHNIDETLFYSVQDWIRGVAEQEDTRQLWLDTQNQMSAFRLRLETLDYIASDGKKYQRPFATDNDLYLITQHIKSNKKRVALKAIKEYLAKAGAFTDALRTNPDTAFDLASNQLAQKKQAYLAQGKSEAWIETRLEGLKSRKAFTEALKTAVIDANGQLYGQATNQVYQGVFGRTANTLREQLDLPKHGEIRDNLHLVGLHYVGLVEAVVSTKLAQYGEDDLIPPTVALELVKAISKHIGANAEVVAGILGMDIATGQALLS